MQPVTISQIVDRLEKLSADQLTSVYEFVSNLAHQEHEQVTITPSESLQTMLASEEVLRRDWDLPEEDAAWQNL